MKPLLKCIVKYCNILLDIEYYVSIIVRIVGVVRIVGNVRRAGNVVVSGKW